MATPQKAFRRVLCVSAIVTFMVKNGLFQLCALLQRSHMVITSALVCARECAHASIMALAYTRAEGGKVAKIVVHL